MCLKGAWMSLFASGALLLVCPQGRAQQNPDLARAVQERPSDSRLQNAYAIALQQQGRFEESLEHFRKALQLDPKYTDAAQNLALALLTGNRPAEALEVLDKHPGSKADCYA